jgi:hypothetical protein
VRWRKENHHIPHILLLDDVGFGVNETVCKTEGYHQGNLMLIKDGLEPVNEVNGSKE